MKILIVYPFECAAYATPVLNLVEVLRACHEVTVVSVASDRFRSGTLSPVIHKAVSVPAWYWQDTLEPAAILARRLNALKAPHSRYQPSFVAMILCLVDEIAQHQPDVVIATDSLGLFLAGEVFDSVVYLSLELWRDEIFAMADRAAIAVVITQTPERFAYFFAGSVERPNSKKLVYFGNSDTIHRIR